MKVCRRISGANIEVIGKYIATLNGAMENHIGYFGTDPSDIEDVLKEILEDEESLIFIATGSLDAIEVAEVVLEGADEGFDMRPLLGVLVLDVDSERKWVEVMGPFSESVSDVVFTRLWEEALNVIGEGYRYQLFFHEENVSLLRFAGRHGFSFKGNELIYEIRDYESKGHKLTLLADEDKEVFVALHNAVFPRTYYDGNEILERVDENQQLFVHYSEQGTLIGYVYIEADPLMQDGSVEFVGVHADYRKQGIGRELLGKALEWFFVERGFTGLVTLCVNEDLKGAQNLYEAVGFERKKMLLTYLREG
ncbi:GNAT family N-acetyltransferase [Bacillus carboniphilus]|uniref:GNAT family N-acetyltransferase n=1 Tax=Bacillus carboniphilus TaxID=86663 RepID=A0ABP3FM14_9BACI